MKKKCENHWSHCHAGGAIYGMGFVGTAVYYISTATGFWNGVWGVVKAIVWPAILAFQLFKQFGL